MPKKLGLVDFAKKIYSIEEIDGLLSVKQDLLTFDDEPVSGSSNPVTSDGIRSAIDEALSGLGKVLRWKGSVPTYEDLPKDGVEVGDVYNVVEDGMNVACAGHTSNDDPVWDPLGPSMDMYLTKDEAQAAYQKKLTPGQGISIDDANISISDGGVSNSMLATNAVNGAKIANLSVSTGKLTNGAVSTAKIADGAVTAAKIDQTVLDNLATKADATLTEIAEFSEWIVRANGEVTTDAKVRFTTDPTGKTFYQFYPSSAPSVSLAEFYYPTDTRTSIVAQGMDSAPGVEFSATRTKLSSSYKLGSQSDKPLQPAGDYALKSEIPAKVSDLDNDVGYITDETEFKTWKTDNPVLLGNVSSGTAKPSGAVIIGNGASTSSVNYANPIAIGNAANANNSSAIAIGSNITVSGLGSAQLGHSDTALSSEKTFRFRDTVVVNRNGKIPSENLDKSFVQAVVGKTWSELKAMRDDGTLVPGQWYRITDYVATTNGDMNSQSANHPFDIIVTADDEGTINERAMAIQHSGDTYFADCDLAAWDVWYCLDNDTTKFAWADSTNGKGVIYRLVDEFQNDVPYDFKGIKFKAYGDTDNVYRYTFDSGTASGNTDYSLTYSRLLTYVFQNKILPYREETKRGMRLNRIVLKGGNCYCNTFGSHCYSNTSDHDYRYNTLGNNCGNNTFGASFYSNTLGNNCGNNTFGQACTYNTFGQACTYNTFGIACSNNTFGSLCHHIKFGTDSTTKSYCRYVRVASGNNYLYINPTGTTSSATCYQNVEIREGVNNATTAYKTITDSNVGQTFLTTYKPANSKEISV